MPAWILRSWRELTVDELYALMRLRQQVFVVEQSCPYLDPDGIDPRCSHLWTHDGDGPVAYLRIVPPGAVYDEPSLGRVVTAPPVRRSGLGRLLVAEGIARVEAAFGRTSIRIGAQLYLERFYASFGFARASPEYLEDGIPHVKMLRPAG